jgi:glucose/mannose-6-phosphate isomerase
MMLEVIRSFPNQFAFDPAVVHAEQLPAFKKYVVLGMGGSQQPSTLLHRIDASIDIVHHRDYGLPQGVDLSDRLLIASSYSGNTEETIDGALEALRRGLPLAIVTTGGELLRMAREQQIPHVIIPDTGIQPRCALGYAIRSLMAIMGRTDLLESSRSLTQLDADRAVSLGTTVAAWCADRVPVVYASTRNEALAYIWKIKYNETGKIPAFCNAVPELNHNEMNGYDVVDATRALSASTVFILLRDATDDPRIIRRMDVQRDLLRARGLQVEEFDMVGATAEEQIFSTILVADWASLIIAERYGLDPETVKMIEEFKRAIA